MSKLTLSVDPLVTRRAKRYAESHGVSISQMVETYLDLVSKPKGDPTGDAPVLRSLRGTLKRADLAAYRQHLEKKYK